jgi:hypothetical protein
MVTDGSLAAGCSPRIFAAIGLQYAEDSRTYGNMFRRNDPFREDIEVR